MNNVLFHIGMPRTGTTTLQRNLFPNEEFFVPLPNGDNGKPAKVWRSAGIAEAKPTSFCEFQETRELIRKLTNDGEATGRRVVISDEGVTSMGSSLLTQELTGQRLKKVAENPMVLLVLRRQQDMLRSRYTQHKLWKQWATLGLPLNELTNSGRRELYGLTGRSVLRFDRWAKYGIKTQYGNWFSVLNYDSLVDVYIRELGKDNVHVLFFEDLKQDPRRFAGALSRMLGMKEEIVSSALEKKRNVSSGSIKRKMLKPTTAGGIGLVNLARLGIHKALGKGGIDPVVNDELSALIRRTWGDENRKLSERLNVSLDQKGYFVDQP